MNGDWLNDVEIYRDIPAKAVATVAGYNCNDDTKLEILANFLIVMEDHPFLDWKEILRKARSLRMRERMGRFDRNGHDVQSAELPELSYWEKPEEDRDKRNDPLFRVAPLLRDHLNGDGVFGDMLSNGMSVVDAARVAGVPMTTARRRVEWCFEQVESIRKNTRKARV